MRMLLRLYRETGDAKYIEPLPRALAFYQRLGFARTVETRTAAGGVLERRTLPAGVALAAVPAPARLRFTAIGTADNGTVRLASGASARAIVVNQRGRVRVS
jgi:hypothetical protein